MVTAHRPSALTYSRRDDMNLYKNTGVRYADSSQLGQAVKDGNEKLASTIFKQTTAGFERDVPNADDRAWLMSLSKGLPTLGDLRGSVANMRLVRYVMDCARVPHEHYLMDPPPAEPGEFIAPESLASKRSVVQILKEMRSIYTSITFMLADNCATESERERVRRHAAFAQMRPWLPSYSWKDVVLMPMPKTMGPKDYVFLIKDCEGTQSFDRKQCLFIGNANMERFQHYLQTVNRNQ